MPDVQRVGNGFEMTRGVYSPRMNGAYERKGETAICACGCGRTFIKSSHNQKRTPECSVRHYREYDREVKRRRGRQG